jgi:hypothetical protein
MKAARTLLPSLSNSAVLCRAVRAGQLSKRKRMIRTTIPRMRAISVNASGHATRCWFADFDIVRSALSAFVQTESSKSNITSNKKALNV